MKKPRSPRTEIALSFPTVSVAEFAKIPTAKPYHHRGNEAGRFCIFRYRRSALSSSGICKKFRLRSPSENDTIETIYFPSPQISRPMKFFADQHKYTICDVPLPLTHYHL